MKGYPNDEFYLNQHVFADEYFYGKLLTKKLTKIINLAAYKNTGQASRSPRRTWAMVPVQHGAARTAVLQGERRGDGGAVVRDKLVLNVTDGLRGQYDGGPEKNAQFVYPNDSLYFATHPSALTCHQRTGGQAQGDGSQGEREPAVHRYLYYAEQLGLGVVDAKKMQIVAV